MTIAKGQRVARGRSSRAASLLNAVPLLAALCTASFPLAARAQDMTFTPDEVNTADAGTPAGDGGTGDNAAGTGDTGAGGGDIIGQLAGGGGTADQGPREPATHAREVSEEIYAVQQIYALRINRVEIAPSIAFTMNDQYVSHPAAAIAINYWWTNVLAVGASFLWYGGLESESDLNFHVRRSTRLAVPITEYQLGAHLNFTYVPLYGKFNMFNELIFQWDAYVMGGVGFMRTRPVPVIDPEIRSFDFDFRVAFNVGIGIRVFITRWLAAFAELRDYMYLEQLENTTVAIGMARQSPTTWAADGASFTNNVTAQIGLTIFLPAEFDYHKPR